MNKNIEKEYKILLTKEQFEDLCRFYEPLHFVEQVNVYYDTSNRCIESMQGALRIRSKEGKHIFTLKMHDNGNLLEYECEVKNNTVEALGEPSIQSLLTQYNINGSLHQTTTLVTKRAIVEDEYAQLCFDINLYNGMIDYEIEYEYKKDHDGRKQFSDILNKINVSYTKNCKAKIARALNK